MSTSTEVMPADAVRDGAEGAAQPLRVLGGGFALAAGVGGIIGLGILRTPGEIGAVITHPALYVALWLVVGLFILLNISVAAELVSLTPRSGGYYTLVRRALGPYPGFLMGWIDWLSFPASIALKAVVLSEYLVLLLPALSAWQAPLAVAVTSMFAALQIRGLVLGASIQQLAAAGTGLIIIAMTLALLLAAPVAATDPALVNHADSSLRAYGLVLAAIVFTYDGWLVATYFNGEVRGGPAVVARAAIRSVMIIIVLYVGLNAALVFSVPLDRLAGEELALAAALDIAWGGQAGNLVILAAILILAAHQNFNYLTAPRTLYALSLDGYGARRAATMHSRGNPLFAVFMTWLVTVALIIGGGFEFLLNLSVLFFIALYIAVLAGVIILRKREPDTVRGYRAWGHPFSTWFFLLCWVGITGFMAYAAPWSAISALAMTAISVPVFLVLNRLRAGEHRD